MKWTREPEEYSIHSDRIEITTVPHTDLWQRTYYHFRNDNAPVLQVETEPVFGPVRPGDIRHSNADISKARRLLGYAPDYDFAKGLAEAIQWYKDNL